MTRIWGNMLVEREHFIVDLQTLAERAVAGKGAVALVSGEAGIGKSALLSEFRNRADGRFCIAWGGCEALFTPRPLGPLHDMSSVFGGEVRRLLEAHADPASIFNALLREATDKGKAKIFVFEDVHWADHATLDFLKFLGRRIPMMNSLIVMSFRDDEVDSKHPLHQVIGDLPQSHVHRLPLTPLSRQGVAQIDTDHFFEPEKLLEITGGNPFFVTEILADYQADGREVPASVLDSVNARLNRLSANERGFLETVSVIPASLDPEVIKALFEEDGDMLAMACVGRKLLIEDNKGKLRFRHELARLATMSRLSSMRLQMIHARVLEALSDNSKGAPLDLLVHHAAGALKGKRVLELAPKAARIAATLGAHREAAAHFETALRFIDEAEPELAAELYEGWAYEAGIALKIDDAVLEARRHAVTLWRALNRPEKVGDNLRWLSRLHWYRGEASKANHFANEAVRVLETTAPSAERAMAYSFRSQLHMLNDRMDEAIEWGEKALRLAKKIGHAEARIHALNNIGTAKAYQEDEDGVSMLRESLALALEGGFHEHAARVYTNLSCYAVDFRRFDLADEILNEGIAFDTQHDLDAWTHYLVGVLAQLRLEQGRMRDAETIANSVLKLDRLTLLMKLPAASVIARIRMRRKAPQAMEYMTNVLSQAVAIDEVQYVIPARFSLIEFAWLQDSPKKAHEQIEALDALDPATLNPWHAGELQVWAQRTGYGLPDRAGPLPAPFAAELAGKGSRAASLWLDLGAPYAAALSYIATAEDDPATYLAEAIRILSGMEAHGASDKARRLAKTFGVEQRMPRERRGPYRVARGHPLGLTKREQEVFRLLCRGASNKDIAEKFCRSPRTIEHHVSSILTKLKVQSRMEAMMRVRNEPWIVESRD